MLVRDFAASVAAIVLTVSGIASPVLANHHEAAMTRFSLDTPITTLVANPAAKAVLEQNMPTILSNGHFPLYKQMSLNQLANSRFARISPEKMAAVRAGLAKIR